MALPDSRSEDKSQTVKLVSPEYSLEIFCYRMLGRDPLCIMESASAEISYARLLHQKSTKDLDFRKGSLGRAYCDDLQQLISLLMNGTIPSNAMPEFLGAVRPLIQQLLARWEIGELRRVFS